MPILNESDLFVTEEIQIEVAAHMQTNFAINTEDEALPEQDEERLDDGISLSLLSGFY